MLTRIVKIIVMLFFIRCFYFIVDLISKNLIYNNLGLSAVSRVLELILFFAIVIISFIISEILVDKMVKIEKDKIV